jgi:hypothetical protein
VQMMPRRMSIVSKIELPFAVQIGFSSRFLVRFMLLVFCDPLFLFSSFFFLFAMVRSLDVWLLINNG